ncbi:MAG: VanW family protein [Clostridia bacterium]|nr:VanW family protein [Clostridia bacterium]
MTASDRTSGNNNRSVYSNQDGLFAAPSDLGTAMNRPLIPSDHQTNSDPFLYDDQDLWRQPLPQTRMRQRSPMPQTAHKSEKQKRSLNKTGGKQAKDGHRNWHAYLYVGIIAVCFLCMSVLVVMMMPQMAGYFWTDFDNYAFVNGELLRYDKESHALYQQYRSYVNRDVIYPGVFVDGVSVGDMTIEEARTALAVAAPSVQSAQSPYSVTIAIGDKSWLVDQTNVPATRNLGNVLEKAYAIGRTNTTDIQITQQTPFRQRVNQAMSLRTNVVNLTTDVTYDTDAVRGIVDEITAYVTRDPVNAQILSFDYKSRSFTFTDDQVGVRMDSELLYQRLTAALEEGQTGTTVTTNLTLIPPDITKETLTTNFNLIAAYTTDTTGESNRNTNINLACQAINGTALLPGETFSFNKATGQRTVEKGYKAAGAIVAGQSIEEVGGGICQVSSTLFNAAARADLEIVERSPHAWPSTYVDRGEDATVNWPNLDFKFRNNTDAPIFIITYYSDRKMSAEIWGISLGEGVHIDLESKTVRTIEPSYEVKYVQNPELPVGTSKTKVKSRTGYVVETYKVWYLNGQETKRELMHTSTYNAYQQVVEYN